MKKLCIVLCLLSVACTPNNQSLEDRDESDKYKYYVVYCKHPLGHVMRHVINKSSWRNTYGSRNGVYRFRDVEGVFHENSGHCYTNDKEIVDKEGNLK